MAILHNETPVPSFDGGQRGDEFRDEEILRGYVGFSQQGVTLKGGQGVLPAGCAIARETATKKYVVYDNGGAGGAEICRGILRDKRDTGTGDGARDILGNMVKSGELKNSKLSGIDSAALADLNARQDTVLDLFKF